MALGGLCDPRAERGELEQWSEYTEASFSLRMFPGDHFYLHDAEAALLQMLGRELLIRNKVIA